MIDPNDYPCLYIKAIVIDGKSDASIGACFREAILLAAKTFQNVRLTHNGKIWSVSPNNLILAVEQEKEA